MQMTRLEWIHGLAVQNPPSLEFGASDLEWSSLRDRMDRVAKIPFARLDDFVRGESNNKDCPTRFHVETRGSRNAVGGILENIMYWCSFGPDDHSVPKRGCMCHFIAKRLSADPSVVLIVYNDQRHVDNNGSPCHGPQDMIENSASKITGSIQHGGEPEATGSAAPSLLEGMQVLEKSGKETMDLLISETGIQVEKKSGGGPEQLECLYGKSSCGSEHSCG